MILRVLIILESIHILVFIKQNVKLEFQELLLIGYYNWFDVVFITFVGIKRIWSQNASTFCTWALGVLEQDPELFCLFGDEATFHSNGCLNRHNYHYWSPVNPHWYRQISASLDPSCLGGNMPWWNRRTSLFWIYRLRCNLFTVSSGSFVRISWEHYINIRQSCWFQQDSTPTYFHHDVRTFLYQQYPNRWIDRRGLVPWSPRSPDLNPPDFFSGVIQKILFTRIPD